MHARSVLVFPAGMPGCIQWARQSSNRGWRVVGASSLVHDPARGNYPEWAFLPWIRDAEFAPALARCVNEHGIDGVYTAHPVVWPVLRELLPQIDGGIQLESAQPWSDELAEYREYRTVAGRLVEAPLPVAARGDLRPVLPAMLAAGLVRQFQLIPGQCDYPKLEALMAISRRMPRGDVVEIGSLFGRSAVVLAFLSRHYGIGNVLCVDPWQADGLRQGDPELDKVWEDLPVGEVFDAFRMNLAPFEGGVNYLRAPSANAAARYARERTITTTDFGTTRTTGQIALLHIDGNHAADCVRCDVALWSGYVMPHGWIVFDDYCWPFGDGPRRVADHFHSRLRDETSCAFVAGGALFLQAGDSGFK